MTDTAFSLHLGPVKFHIMVKLNITNWPIQLRVPKGKSKNNYFSSQENNADFSKKTFYPWPPSEGEPQKWP